MKSSYLKSGPRRNSHSPRTRFGAATRNGHTIAMSGNGLDNRMDGPAHEQKHQNLTADSEKAAAYLDGHWTVGWLLLEGLRHGSATIALTVDELLRI